ncbi:MAG: hypothetical protein AAFW84_27405, partial [Cyanobacteria bacterium J06635_15]
MFKFRKDNNRAGKLTHQKIHVGCGPKNLLEDWCNVDIRGFPGIDVVMDVTQEWPWKEIEYVYGEHFIEHLSLEGAISFLESAGNSLKAGGKIRVSTPSLEWVLTTHFTFQEADPQVLNETLKTNRAFHGWGHQFLYTKPMLSWLLTTMGYADVTFCQYGESSDPNLRNLERHGGYSESHGFPS